MLPKERELATPCGHAEDIIGAEDVPLDDVSKDRIRNVLEPLMPPSELLLTRKLEFLRWLYHSGRLERDNVEEGTVGVTGTATDVP